MDERPIGVFDSGLGGLTAVRRLRQVLPEEDLVFLGDTGRVPYGSRSAATIRRYAAEDMDFLLRQGVKAVVVACGTVSSIALHTLTDRGIPAPFRDLIPLLCREDKILWVIGVGPSEACRITSPEDAALLEYTGQLPWD